MSFALGLFLALATVYIARSDNIKDYIILYILYSMYVSEFLKPGILIIDDEPLWHGIIGRILYGAGISTQPVETVDVAVKLIRSTSLRGVITDDLGSEWKQIVQACHDVNLQDVVLLTEHSQPIKEASENNIFALNKYNYTPRELLFLFTRESC